jgi:hypothetical protein
MIQACEKFPTKALLSLIDSIQAKNTGVREEEVMEDVTQAVESVRKERYEEGAGAFPIFYKAFTLTDLGGVAGSVQRFAQRCHGIWRSAEPASGWRWSQSHHAPDRLRRTWQMN